MTCIRCNAKSFGEAFHVSAAATLDGDVTWRVERGDDGQQARARHFLCATTRRREDNDSPVVERAPEATRRVAVAFASGACCARLRLARRWRLPQAQRREVERFADSWFSGLSRQKVLVWNRKDPTYQRERNTSGTLRDQLGRLCNDLALLPIFVGHTFGGARSPCDLAGFWKEHPFSVPETSYQAQLHFVLHLRRAHGLVAQLGNRTGTMDGHALLGLPTLYFENGPAGDGAQGDQPNQQRMEQWTRAVPNYRRVILRARDTEDLRALETEEQTEVKRCLQEWSA